MGEEYLLEEYDWQQLMEVCYFHLWLQAFAYCTILLLHYKKNATEMSCQIIRIY